MRINSEVKENYMRIIISGKEEATPSELMSSLEHMNSYVSTLVTNGHVKFVFDLSLCDYINSSIISLFVSAKAKVIKNSGWIKLIVPPDKSNIREILELIGMDKIASIYENEKEINDGEQ